MQVNVNEITEKMEKLDDMLKKDFFSNPIREVQENIRNQLLEFNAIFHKNLNDMENYIVNYFIINYKGAIRKESSSKSTAGHRK